MKISKKEVSVKKFTILALVVLFAYAIIRYNIIKGVSWDHFPLFISNKAISLSAVFFIGLSYALGSLAKFWPRTFEYWLKTRKYFGLLGFGLAALHGLISLIIFSPAYYSKFFSDSGNLNLIGELSLLFGVLAFFVFSLVAVTSIPSVEKALGYEKWIKAQRLGYMGLILILLHVLVMGIEGWFNPRGWPGGLLPISLVAFIFIALALLIKLSGNLLKR